MAARCFPAEPEFEHHTERAVWERTRDQLPDDAVLLANLRFTDRHADLEADLVVALPGAGVAVLEVKGGAVTHDGLTWRQTGGGAQDKPIDPAGQARRAKYALRTHLDKDERWRRRRVRFAHLVVLPTSLVAADVNPTDCPRWMVVDSSQLGALVEVIRDVLQQQESQNPPASAQDVEDFVDIVTGRPASQREAVDLAASRELECDLLTQRQAKILDAIRLLPRVEVRGGAGSGKTWLALEQARRLAKDGKRVGLLCYSRGLSAYLKRRVALLPDGQRPAYVGEFHALGVAWGAPPGLDDDSDYWEHRLPAAMGAVAQHLSDAERYDAFVVDEAQDFADSWWPALIQGLRDRERGGLYAFADEGQRVSARHGRPPVELIPMALDENLRNTKQIAQTFGSLTPTQMTYRGAEGVPVRFVPSASADAIGAADDVVVELLADGWKHEHVALLTTGHRHPVQVEQQAHGHDAYWESYWAGDDVFFGHVLGFKGLERPVVVLAVNGFRHGEERAREMLYVGLSRARDLLVVCGDPGVILAVGGVGVLNRLTT
ncbi:MAG: NERD domain-containing protein [Sporichthyaceae bacterium]|nr:NERD domain-containing protein [Sporichthyaceae bacterium]